MGISKFHLIQFLGIRFNSELIFISKHFLNQNHFFFKIQNGILIEKKVTMFSVLPQYTVFELLVLYLSILLSEASIVLVLSFEWH